MIEGVSFRSPVFVNTLGHTSGLFIFGLLILLLLKSRKTLGTRDETASLFAASLAFFWNLGSLVALAFVEHEGQVPDWLVAVNFSVLSLLPAVLFSVLLKQKWPILTRCAYTISGCAIALHFAELRLESSRLHETALLIVTVGFALLGTAVLALVWFNGRVRSGSKLIGRQTEPQSGYALWRALRNLARRAFERRSSSRGIFFTDVLCLMLFAFSFLHFGYGHSRTAWTSEVGWHHAGIPLALIVLLRDYRLLVAETFIRFIANVGLAGLFAISLYLANTSGSLIERAYGNGFLAALLVVAFCGCLIAFAYLRAFMQKRLTEYVFARGDLNICAQHILRASSDSHTEQQFLSRASAEIAQFIEAERFQLNGNSASEQQETDLPQLLSAPRTRRWAEVQLPLRFSRGDVSTLLLGRRHGSRRYLGEDMAALQSLASLVIEQVERLRANELQMLAHQAELRALQAQVNPHFLFNALNTLYGVIGRESFEARRLVLNLADLFRYSLRHDRNLTTLGEELEIVQAYLEIESLRLAHRLTFEVKATTATRAAKVPVLSIQPLVENAIKHGVSKLSSGGHVEVAATEAQGVLKVTIRDNGPGLHPNSGTSGLGIGLENVRQRLRLGCNAGSDLTIKSDPQGCLVTLSIVLDSSHQSQCVPQAGAVSESVVHS